MATKTIYLIDGSSFAYRAFYAIGQLITHAGQPTNAVYGFTRMLNKLVDKYKPEYLMVAFDTGKPTFRHKQYEQYKAHRKPMPDDMISQIPYIKRIISAYNIPLIEMEGFEADDILATMAVRAESEGFNVYIVTGDKDMMQLVNSRIKIISPAKEDLVYDSEKIKEKFRVEPSKLTHLLALAGDSSDNIQGVPGIGEKTASQLIHEFGDINRLFSNLDNISPKLKTAISEHKKEIIDNLDLVTIKKDIEIDIKPEDCAVKEPNKNVLKDIFRELEFNALLKGLLEKDPPKSSDCVDISSQDQWLDVLGELKNVSAISVTKDSLAYEKDNKIKSIKITGLQDILELLQNPDIKKYGYDIKSLMTAANAPGMPGDTRRGGQSSTELRTTSAHKGVASLTHKGVASLTVLAPPLFMGRASVDPKDRTLTKGASIKGSIFDVHIAESLLERQIIDKEQILPMEVYKAVPELEKMLINEGLFDLYNRIELPLIEVLAGMENYGIKLDVNVLKKLSAELERDLRDLTEKIYKLAGETFNINSPKQLEHILFEKLNLPKGKRTKTGYSTDVGVLDTLTKYHELPGYMLDYRQLNKLKSTYIDPLPQMVDPKTQRLHTTFNQVGAVTGRISSSNPNLQNIPIKTDMGKRIRSAFIPGGPDLVLLGADYSQIELRILAHLSGDKTLIRTFEEDKDIHTQTAQEIFGVPESGDVAPELRRQAKIVNFGIIYGMGAKTLAGGLGISIDDAQRFIDTYMERYPNVAEYIRDELNEAKEHGYVVTMFGRKRRVPELSSSKPQEEAFGRRIAINTPIQGSAADIIKMAMINIYRKFKEKKFHANMLLQIHDELIFELPEDSVDEVSDCVKEEMENVVKLKVPIKVDIKVGRSWADL